MCDSSGMFIADITFYTRNPIVNTKKLRGKNEFKDVNMWCTAVLLGLQCTVWKTINEMTFEFANPLLDC